MAAALVTSLTPQELNALSNVSALSPPAGVKSNFVDPENQSLSFFIVTSILLGIMVVFFTNRVCTKMIIIRKFSWDDITIVLAFMSSLAYYVASIWGVQKGKIGVHQWDLSIPDLLSLDLLIPEYLNSILTEVALLFTKVSFFLMYLDIFGPMQWMRVSASLGAFINSAFYLAILIANLIFSTPRPGQTWAAAAVNEQGSLALSIPQAVGGLVIDLYILLLPIIAVSHLQLPPRKKIGVILIFMSGLFAVVASVLKIYYSNVLNHSPDLTWAALPINIVTFTEISVGISCACMPSAAHTLRHLPPLAHLKSALSRRLHSLSPKASLRSSNSSVFNDQKRLVDSSPPRKAVRTFIHSSPPPDLEHNFPARDQSAIYRSVEMRTDFPGVAKGVPAPRYDPRTRRPAPHPPERGPYVPVRRPYGAWV
ncbi:hypothetical protein MMC13_003724 [Lambiella insularis]|nr:hypothetical protein [Lambiella insularis]